MKKFFILLFLLSALFLNANRFWDHEKNYKQILTVESVISYSPSVVNYIYTDDKSKGYYFSDCIQWNHLFNIYPVFQTGTIINYVWYWGLRTFALRNMYRIFGFNFDVGNLSFRVSLMDMGFTWFKYEWNKAITDRNNQFCFLYSPITISIAYRIMLNRWVDVMVDLGYSMQLLIDNKIVFPNSNIDASMFLDNVFNMGLGFRFYTYNFK